MRLPDRVAPVVEAYLGLVDQEAPGLVEGLYLAGSTALGEFKPRTSDIDYLAVTSHPPADAEVAALARAHVRLRRAHRRPNFDGRYVTWAELARDPREAGPGPYSHLGRFHARGRGDCDPVTWHTVATVGVPCRGPRPGDIAIWTSRPALMAWALGNLASYWRPLLRRARRFPDPWSLTAFTSYGAAWIVLGVSRLHYTLTTGRIASKAEAGRYGIQAFPGHWHRVLNEALRIRAADRARPDVTSAISEVVAELRTRPARDGGSLYPTLIARRNEVLAFGDAIVDEATEQTGSHREWTNAAPARPGGGTATRRR